MKKTKKQNFVARILTWIRNLVRIVRLLCRKKHKKAVKIVKNETKRTVEITSKNTFWFLENIIPVIITGLIIMAIFCIMSILGVGFSSESDINWFIGLGSLVLFVLLYELTKHVVKHIIDKFIPKE